MSYNVSHLNTTNPHRARTHFKLWAKTPFWSVPQISPFGGNSFLGIQRFSNRGHAGRGQVARGSSSADAILLRRELKYITGQVVEGSYWPVFWTGTGQYLSKMFFLDKLGTLVADFPTQKPTDLANSRDCQMEEQIWCCHKTYKQKPNRNTEENKSEFNTIHIEQKNDCNTEWKDRRKHNRRQTNITHITET